MKQEYISFVRDAFIQEFGAVLEPLGFTAANTKLPHFIRPVSDEIIHIIGIRSHGTGLSIISNATTVYRRELELNRSKRYDISWQHKISEYYKCVKRYDSERRQELALGWYGYRQNDTDDMLKAMRQSVKDMQKWVLPILDPVRTTNEFIEYLLNMGGYAYPVMLENNEPFPFSDGAIMLTLDDPYYFPEREKEVMLERALYEYEHQVYGIPRTKEQYEENCARINNYYEKNIAILSGMLDDPEIHERCMEELQQRKIRNTKKLRRYGVDI